MKKAKLLRDLEIERTEDGFIDRPKNKEALFEHRGHYYNPFLAVEEVEYNG